MNGMNGYSANLGNGYVQNTCQGYTNDGSFVASNSISNGDTGQSSIYMANRDGSSIMKNSTDYGDMVCEKSYIKTADGRMVVKENWKRDEGQINGNKPFGFFGHHNRSPWQRSGFSPFGRNNGCCPPPPQGIGGGYYGSVPPTVGGGYYAQPSGGIYGDYPPPATFGYSVRSGHHGRTQMSPVAAYNGQLIDFGNRDDRHCNTVNNIVGTVGNVLNFFGQLTSGFRQQQPAYYPPQY